MQGCPRVSGVTPYLVGMNPLEEGGTVRASLVGAHLHVGVAAEAVHYNLEVVEPEAARA